MFRACAHRDLSPLAATFAVATAVTALVTAVTALTTSVTALTTSVTALTTSVTALTTSVTALTTALTALVSVDFTQPGTGISRSPLRTEVVMTLSHPQSTQVAPPSDIFSRVVAGDRSAFDAMVAPVWPKLVRVARRNVRYDSPADAEDAVNVGLLRAWKAREGFQGRTEEATLSWLSSFVRYAAMHHRRSGGRRTRLAALGGVEDAGYDAMDPDSDAGDPEVHASRAAVRVALQCVAPKEADVLWRHHALEHTVLEVAEAVGVSRATVFVRLRDGEASLRRVVTRQDADPSKGR